MTPQLLLQTLLIWSISPIFVAQVGKQGPWYGRNRGPLACLTEELAERVPSGQGMWGMEGGVLGIKKDETKTGIV